MARISSRSGDGGLHQEFRSLGVAQDGAEGLVDLMGEGRGELSHHGDTADMGDLLLQKLGLLLGLLGCRDVERSATDAERLAFVVELNMPARGEPAHGAICNPDAKFHHENARTLERIFNRLAGGSPVLRVKPFQEAIEINPLQLCKTEQLAEFIARPDFVASKITNPDADVDGIGDLGHALLLLLQIAVLQGRLEKAATELVAHRNDDAHEVNADYEGCLDNLPEHKD